eukprot:m.124655 g.124655  ORF g.124655 m.124655 type:complete len:381 (+) comp29071_c0_seq2:247-1389(+)
MFAEPTLFESLLDGDTEFDRIDVVEMETDLDDSPCRHQSSATPTTSDAIVLGLESPPTSTENVSRRWSNVLTPRMLRRSNAYSNLDRPSSILRTNRKQPKKKHVSVSNELAPTITNTHTMVDMPKSVAVPTLDGQSMDVDALEEFVVQAARKLNFDATNSTLEKDSSSDIVLENELPASRWRVFSLTESPPQTRKKKSKRVKKDKLTDRDNGDNANIDEDVDTNAIHTPSQHFQVLQRAAMTSTTPAPLFEGYLTKQGKFRRTWKKRWCIIDEAGLIRYYKPTESAQRGSIDSFCQDGNPDNMLKEHDRAGTRQFQAQKLVTTDTELDATTTWPSNVPDPRCRFAVNTKGRTYFFFADNVTQAGRWKKLLQMFEDRYNYE